MKNKLLAILFKEYKQKLDEKYQLDISLFKATVDEKYIVRERLKGVRPGHPDSNSNYLIDKVNSMETPVRLDFLSKAHTLQGSTVLKEIIEFLMTECMRKATLEASDIVEVNFQRATVNGLSLLEEEILRFSSLYKEEMKRKELMGEGEEFEVI